MPNGKPIELSHSAVQLARGSCGLHDGAEGPLPGPIRNIHRTQELGVESSAGTNFAFAAVLRLILAWSDR